MLPYLQQDFGNAASRTHAFGWRAEAAVDDARERIARSLGGADASEIVFTSGATESNNLAILGLADAQTGKRHLITVVTEHPSVLDPCRALRRRGYELTEIGVNEEGLVDLADIESAIRDDTLLISVMAANSEVGVLQPIAEIAASSRARGIVFHCDAAQAVGKIDFDAGREELDLVSVSAHKI